MRKKLNKEISQNYIENQDNGQNLAAIIEYYQASRGCEHPTSRNRNEYFANKQCI